MFHLALVVKNTGLDGIKPRLNDAICYNLAVPGYKQPMSSLVKGFTLEVIIPGEYRTSHPVTVEEPDTDTR